MWEPGLPAMGGVSHWMDWLTHLHRGQARLPQGLAVRLKCRINQRIIFETDGQCLLEVRLIRTQS